MELGEEVVLIGDRLAGCYALKTEMGSYHSETPSVHQSCVICIGSTGTGKSSTIQKCTRQEEEDAMTGNNLDGVNNKCKIYKHKQEVVNDDTSLHSDFFGQFLWKSFQELVWVDTVGWNDKRLDGTCP